MSFEQYVDYALQVPVYAVIRDSRYYNCTEFTFSELLEGKNENFNSDDITIEDWINHISTIFTEVRLKTFIEMRGADAGNYDSLCALPAFWTGILYQNEALEEAYNITSDFTYEDLMNFRADVISKGLDASYGKINGWALAERFLNISFNGLKKRDQKNLYGDDETVHLDYLFEVITKKENASRKAIERYFSNEVLKVKELFEGESF